MIDETCWWLKRRDACCSRSVFRSGCSRLMSMAAASLTLALTLQLMVGPLAYLAETAEEDPPSRVELDERQTVMAILVPARSTLQVRAVDFIVSPVVAPTFCWGQ